MFLSKRWNKSFFYHRLCFNFWFPILRNSLHVFPKTEQLWNAIFVGAFDTTFVVSKRWWWTSSDGNDFANTFDIKLILVWLTCCGFINYLYYICPRKRKCKSYYLYNDPKEAWGIPYPIIGGGGRGGGRGRSFKGSFGRGVPRPRLSTLPSVRSPSMGSCLCLTFSAPNIQVQVLQTDLHKFPLIVS